MATQRQELSVVSYQPYVVRPTSFHEMQEYCNYLSTSSLCPDAVRGRPADVFMIVQTGAELGLHAIQSLKTFGIINGMPFAYGDGFLGLIKRHPQFEDMKLWFEGELDKKTLTAYCMMKRKNQSPMTESFSMKDAERAGLLNRGAKSAWHGYTSVMLERRAITKVGKFTFPDALYGIPHEDDIYSKNNSKNDSVKPTGKGMKGLEETLGIIDVEFSTESPTEEESINTENILSQELENLVTEKNIPQESIDRWCKKFNVSALNDIPMDGKDKLINHIKEKL